VGDPQQKDPHPFFSPSVVELIVLCILVAMSSNVNIPQSSLTAPTPQNTPLTNAPISAGLSRPTVPDIQESGEDDEDEGSQSPSAGKSNNVGQAGVSGLNPQQHAILTQLVQGKLSGLIGKSSGYIESLPVEVKRNIEALKGVQVEFTKLQKEHKKELLELERKVRRLIVVIFPAEHVTVRSPLWPHL